MEKSIDIKASLEQVWELLALDRLPEWNEEYGNVQYTSELRTPEDKYRVGASSHTNIKGPGDIDFEITESLQNEKLTFRMIGKRAYNSSQDPCMEYGFYNQYVRMYWGRF